MSSVFAEPSPPRHRARRGSAHFWRSAICLAALLIAGSAPADNFASATYEAGTDKLVVTMIYGGTNPNHVFSLQWGSCVRAGGGGERQIDAQVLDDQWQDAAVHDYKKTQSFSLAGLRCRPSVLTLRTAPNFYYTLRIPAARPAAR